MSTLAYPARDSRTILRRNLRRMRRYPSTTLTLIGYPGPAMCGPGGHADAATRCGRKLYNRDPSR
jgi:hypothetical protein